MNNHSTSESNALTPRCRIRVGPAGWSYKDWEGIVYPPHGSKFDHLAYLAHYFDTIEVNSSFYRIPPVTHSKSWLRRIAGNDDFSFTVKLYRGFTHERSALTPDDSRLFKQFLDPLVEAGRLGALLIQYPWSAKRDEETSDRIFALLDDFRDYRCAIEVRHSSFQEDDFIEELRRRKVTFVNIDQPLFHDSVKPSDEVTGPVSYIRLHGRNYQKWFNHEESWERYDYLYSPRELEPWIERAKEMQKESDVFVITNNHFRGQAIVNALEIRAAVGDHPEIPEPLRAAYPDRINGLKFAE